MSYVFLELTKYNYSITSVFNFMGNNLIGLFHAAVQRSIFFYRYYIQNQIV